MAAWLHESLTQETIISQYPRITIDARGQRICLHFLIGLQHETPLQFTGKEQHRM